MKVPEKYDLVLMKTLRGYEHDLETIVEIHAHAPLDLETLVGRYQTEMDAAIISPARLRANFLTAIERLFPEALTGVEKRLGRKRVPSKRRCDNRHQ